MTNQTSNFFHALGAASLAVTISAVTLIATAGPVHAAPVSVARVSYADLNLGMQAGRSAMHARLNSAARQVCDAGAGGRTSEDLRTEARCRRNAVAGAMPQVAVAAAQSAAVASAE